MQNKTDMNKDLASLELVAKSPKRQQTPKQVVTIPQLVVNPDEVKPVTIGKK